MAGILSLRAHTAGLDCSLCGVLRRDGQATLNQHSSNVASASRFTFELSKSAAASRGQNQKASPRKRVECVAVSPKERKGTPAITSDEPLVESIIEPVVEPVIEPVVEPVVEAILDGRQEPNGVLPRQRLEGDEPVLGSFNNGAASPTSFVDEGRQVQAKQGRAGTFSREKKDRRRGKARGDGVPSDRGEVSSPRKAFKAVEDQATEAVEEQRAKGELDPFEEDSDSDETEVQEAQGSTAGRLPRGTPVPIAAVPEGGRLRINLELEVFRAKNLIRAGKLQPAEEMMRKAMKDWPDDGRPYVVLGRLLGRQGRTGAARAVYEQGCQALGGDNAYIWQCWAVLEARLGNTDRARKLFDAATAADEKHAAAWHGWAMLELRQGNKARARQLLERGAKHCGESAYIYQSLAVLAAQSGRLKDARALFLRSTQLNPRAAAPWLAWALLEAEQGEASSARVLFERALESSPKNRYVWQAWGVFEASQGRLSLARKLLTRGGQLHRDDPVMLQSLALLEYSCGFTGAAREIFREASEVDPKHQPVWNAWGWVEWKEARLDVARKLFQTSIEVDPTSPGAARAFQAWAVVEERDGNVALARTLFRRALQVDPSNDVVWRSWAAMEEREGNAVRADELRSLYQQQRVEIVESSWDLASVLTPAIDTMRALFTRPSTAQDDRSTTASSIPTPAQSFLAQSARSETAEKEMAPLREAEQEEVEQEEVEQEDEVTTSVVPVVEGSEERDFDVDAFLAKRLPRTYKKIIEEDRERNVWRRPMSAGEMRRWSEDDE